jgi:hypothetical protein
MDKSLYNATAEFITERVIHHGKQEPGIIQGAVTELCARVDRLKKTLTSEQALVLRDCDNAYAEVDGETMRYYYKAGFGDAIRFLVDWGKQADQ